jgi:hypothetical protein
LRGFLERSDDAVAGIVDKNVDALEAGDRGIDSSRSVLWLCHVQRERQEALRSLGGDLLQRVQPARGCHDVVTLREGVFGEGEAEAG